MKPLKLIFQNFDQLPTIAPIFWKKAQEKCTSMAEGNKLEIVATRKDRAKVVMRLSRESALGSQPHFAIISPCGSKTCVDEATSSRMVKSMCPHLPTRGFSNDMFDALGLEFVSCTPENCPQHHVKPKVFQYGKSKGCWPFIDLAPFSMQLNNVKDETAPDVPRDEQGFFLDQLSLECMCGKSDCAGSSVVQGLVYHCNFARKVTLTFPPCRLLVEFLASSVDVLSAIPVPGTNIFFSLSTLRLITTMVGAGQDKEIAKVLETMYQLQCREGPVNVNSIFLISCSSLLGVYPD